MSTISLKRALLKDWKEIIKIEKTADKSVYSSRNSEKEVKDFIKNDYFGDGEPRLIMSKK